VESECYVLKTVSDKDSVRGRKFAKLFVGMRTGRAITAVCTALDKVSRFVKDFLNFFEILSQ
jgi:hypothetical protein